MHDLRSNARTLANPEPREIKNRWLHRNIEEARHLASALGFITMSINFDQYAESGKAFVRKVAAELGDESNTNRAGQILRSTLHVLRNQSTPAESLQFISQLPMFIKAIYVDGWKPLGRSGRVHRLGDFLAAIQQQNPGGFLDDEECLMAVEAVFQVIQEYVSEGEMEDLKRTLPEELHPLFA